jgi:hypothetical protein
MQFQDEGGMCSLYIEPADKKDNIFHAIGELHKPLVLVIPASTAGLSSSLMFGKPRDYSDLKHLLRTGSIPPIYLISSSNLCRGMAQRNGLPAYPSIEALSESLSAVSQEPSPTCNGHQRAETQSTIQTAYHGTSHAIQQKSSPSLAPPMKPPKSRVGVVLLIVSLLLLLVLGGCITYYAAFFRDTTARVTTAQALQSVGGVYFLSSEQVNESGDQGMNDEIEIEMHAVVPPAPGQTLYAWLLPDKNQGDANALLLGTLTVQHDQSATLLYSGDRQHSNLLATYSRFLITSESTSFIPIAPSLDTGFWRYYAEIPQVAVPGTGSVEVGAKTFSVLDHLRHLLVDDPTLSAMDLPGGLNNWLYRNTGKILEWALSARDYIGEGADPQFLRRQIIRVLAYLDGLTYVQADLPANTYLPLTTRLVRMGLIDVQPNQRTPSILFHIVFHLTGLLNSVGVTAEQRARATQILDALNHVQTWLEKMRSDAQQLMALPDTQLFSSRALTLYNDMVLMARAANDGQINPATAQIQEGVVSIHMMLSSLATLAIKPYVRP